MTVPSRRPNRPSRVFGLLWIMSMFVAGSVATSLGAGSVRAKTASPNANLAAQPPAAPVECGGVDSAGPLPEGDQSIGGLVTDTSATPLADVQVYVESPGQGRFWVFTNAEGRYLYEGLGNATYYVSFYDDTATYQSSFYDGATVSLTREDATPIVLSGGGAADIDAALPAETRSVVSGFVTDPDGQGVDGAYVEIRGQYFGGLASCAYTEPDGSYELLDVRAGVHKGEAFADGFPPTGPTDPSIVVPPNDTTVDFQFPEVHTLSGVVRDAGGFGIDQIAVSATRVGGGGGGFGFSESDGSFQASGLVAGSYIIRYEDGSGLGRYRTGYYGGENVWVATRAEALPVEVPGGPITLRVVPAPKVFGTITAPGVDADLISVNLCDETQENCFSANADGSGVFSVGVGLSGTYIANVYDNSGTYLGGYIGAGGTIVRDAEDAVSIVVDDDDVGPIYATLPEGGHISAHVTVAGVAFESAYVQLCVDEFGCPDAFNTDGSGDGTSPALWPGTYYVSATGNEFAYWFDVDGPESLDFANATPIVVSAGSSDLIALDLPGVGTPTDPGPGEVTVALDDGSGNTPVSVTFDSVTASGTTSLTVFSEFSEPIPSGFQLGLPAAYFDISTTASYTAPITVCVSYAGMSFSYEGGIQLWHYDSSIPGWDPITTEIRPAPVEQVCGVTNSLSPFAIVEPLPTFTGFFQPVDNDALNRAKAGAGVPVKFSLGANFGLAIFADGYPSVTQIACPGTTVDVIEQTVTVGSSHLVYDATKNQYVYQFKSSKSWAGTCQQLTMVFIDGTTRTANFQFTR